MEIIGRDNLEFPLSAFRFRASEEQLSMQNKTQHSNLTRALGGLWAAPLWWGNLVVWRLFGLPGQIVCA